MEIKKVDRVPPNVVPRLSRYYRILCDNSQKERISSQELSNESGFTAAQIRKDLGYFGQFGYPGRGYNVEELKGSIGKILGLDRRWNVALVGVGNLGLALLGYKGFRKQGFDIVAAFDADRRKTGKKVNGVKINSIKSLPQVAKKLNIQMAIITVPDNAAQNVADLAVMAGVKAILNFAPVRLKLPESTKIRNIDMTIEIERLSFLISRE